KITTVGDSHPGAFSRRARRLALLHAPQRGPARHPRAIAFCQSVRARAWHDLVKSRPPAAGSNLARTADRRSGRRHRNAAKLSREKLAHRADIDRIYVSSLEQRVYAADIYVVDRLARALGVKASDLLRRPRQISQARGSRPTEAHTINRN